MWFDWLHSHSNCNPNLGLRTSHDLGPHSAPVNSVPQTRFLQRDVDTTERSSPWKTSLLQSGANPATLRTSPFPSVSLVLLSSSCVDSPWWWRVQRFGYSPLRVRYSVLVLDMGLGWQCQHLIPTWSRARHSIIGKEDSSSVMVWCIFGVRVRRLNINMFSIYCAHRIRPFRNVAANIVNGHRWGWMIQNSQQGIFWIRPQFNSCFGEGLEPSCWG